jgi:hypothetical protein
LTTHGLAVFRKTLGEDDPNTLFAWEQLAWMTAEKDEAESRAVYAAGGLIRALGPAHPRTLEAQELVLGLIGKHRFNQFEQLILKSFMLDMWSRSIGENHPRITHEGKDLLAALEHFDDSALNNDERAELYSLRKKWTQTLGG